jgi:site-specific DNA recombinase
MHSAHESLVSLPSPVRASGYFRVSTDQQTEGYSLDNQRAACQRYATEHHYQFITEYVEGEGKRGVSGGATDRPVMNRLLRDAQQRPRSFDVVVIYDTSRLARDDFMWYGGWVEEQLAACGVTVEYVKERFSQDPASQLHKQILRGVNTFYKQTTAIRGREGLVARAKQGVWPGGMPPLGYDVIDHRLVLNPDEAQLVERIFRLYTEQRLTVVQIATRLFQEGIPTKWQRLGTKHTRYQPSWDRSSLYRLLTNSAYIGQFVWGRKKNPRHQTWLSNEQVTIPCPAIISQELWTAARQRMPANRHHGRRDKRYPYLVSGLLHCAVCGRTMSGQPTKQPGQQTYFCNPTPRAGHTFCYNRARFRSSVVDAAVWDVVTQGLREPAQLQTVLQRQLTTEASDTVARLQGVAARLTALERKGAEVLQLDTSTAFARDHVAQLLADLGRQRDALQQEQQRLQATLGGAPGAGLSRLEEMRRWLVATPLTALDADVPDALPPAVAALPQPLSAAQQSWLFRLRQRIVRDLVGSVTLNPDGTGALYVQGDTRPLPLQVPALPPRKKGKTI